MPDGLMAARFYRRHNKNYIEITVAGEKDTLRRQVEPNDINRFEAEWKAYEEGLDRVPVTGTNLEELPHVDQDRANGLRLQGVHTVEQLAELHDGLLQNIGMGAIDLRNAAQNYLAAADSHKQEREIEELKRELAALKADKPKRGRPRKQEQL
tara:strand:- start:891 stop:1349 length:459 start_codon:yes stop_codon:yes gene_type:complete